MDNEAAAPPPDPLCPSCGTKLVHIETVVSSGAFRTQAASMPQIPVHHYDCPSCNANNPWPDGLHEADEVHCHYCGTSYVVRISDGGKLKLKEL